MKDQQDIIKVEISHKTIIFTVLFLLGLWFLVLVKEIIILIFVAILLLAALLRPVEWLVSKKIPRVLAVILVYAVVIAFLALSIRIIIPPLIEQSVEFANRFPQILASVNGFLNFHQIPINNLSGTLASSFQNLAGNIIKIGTTVFSSLFLIITIFVMTFYLLLDWRKFVLLFASPFSGKQEKKVINIVSKVEAGLGRWVRGQLSLSVIVGALVFIGLTILGIPYALPLALIAGFLEIIPVVGPIASSIPAILVGLTISPVIALATVALFIIVQQLENNFIVPMIMSKVVGLQPPVLMVALLIGAKIAGLGGAFLAVPFLIVIKIVITEILSEEQHLDENLTEE